MLRRMRQENFAIEFLQGACDPDEQVLKYSDAIPQVPYNQQLGLAFARCYREIKIRRIMVL
jgi:hypothetical protein